MPNYQLVMMQLEQQMAAALEQQQQLARGIPLDFSQNLVADQTSFQKRIFGEYRLISPAPLAPSLPLFPSSVTLGPIMDAASYLPPSAGWSSFFILAGWPMRRPPGKSQPASQPLTVAF
jgi:hypothetical protein